MRRIETELLACAARLLLEYNESTGAIHRRLKATAQSLTDEPFHLAVSYGGVVVALGDESPVVKSVHELRYNTQLQARVCAILGDVCSKKLDAASALTLLQTVETHTPRHSRTTVTLLVAGAAACLAALLGADIGAIATAGLSTGLGVIVRQELGRRHFALLSLPLSAAFIGAAFGGVAIRFNWTGTPGLAVIVPSLMVVPGPHLINGLLDLIENYVPMSLARLGLATAILCASAVGVIAGLELTLSLPPVAGQNADTRWLTLFYDMLLAGIVTCGFAVYYNASWKQVGMAVAGGMLGHGLRFLALQAHFTLEVSTFFGGFAVGAVSALIARSCTIPVAVVAFAGAVTMMPGIQMYRALGGVLNLAQDHDASDASMLTNTLGDAMQSALVVASLSLGLVVAARSVIALAGFRQIETTTPNTEP